jgi:hypothetical protein
MNVYTVKYRAKAKLFPEDRLLSGRGEYEAIDEKQLLDEIHKDLRKRYSEIVDIEIITLRKTSKEIRDKIKKFKNYSFLLKELDGLIEEYISFESKLTSPKISVMVADKVTSSLGNMTEANNITLISLKEQIEKTKEKLLDERRMIEEIISNVAESKYRILLRNRYINNMTFEKIASDMSYTWQHIHFMHSEALKQIKI